MIQGLDHFIKHFEEEKSEFVIIGGLASGIILGEVGLPARKTKDIDLVILANPSVQFAGKLRRYIEEGGYESLQNSEPNKEVDGVPVANANALIPLKARAYLDLKGRKNEGKNINSFDIEKHWKDVFRLSLVLVDGQSVQIHESIRKDLNSFLALENDFSEQALKQSIGAQFGTLPESIKAIRQFFQL